MDARKNQIRISLDGNFDFRWLEAQIIGPARSAGLAIEGDMDTTDWGRTLEGMHAPHTYRALYSVLIDPLFFSVNNLSESSEILPSLLIKTLDSFSEHFRKSGGRFEEFLKDGLRLYTLSVYYFDDQIKLNFIFDISSDFIEIFEAWKKMTEMIFKVQREDEETKNWLASVHTQKNNLIFLLWNADSTDWELIDRLADACLRLSTEYKLSINDTRIRKPYLIFNEENFNQYIHVDKQWTLHLDQESIILPQPNDLALYIGLMERSLKDCETFYVKEHTKRSGKLHMPLLFKDEYLKYYDYFQSIISAVIFSYTAIECLANISIPYDYKYTVVGQGQGLGIDKVFTKGAIERHLSLKIKLQKVLPDVLKTGDPTKEKWWKRFEQLKDIRDEIIHTKQSTSEERFGKFLAADVFEVIRCSLLIIRFYGEYISKNQPNLLFDYPYGFGFDTVPPTFMSNKSYVDHYNALHNPWRPNSNAEESAVPSD